MVAERFDVRARQAEPVENDSVPAQRSVPVAPATPQPGFDAPVLFFAGAAVLGLALFVVLLTTPWVGLNPYLLLGEAPGLEDMVEDEWIWSDRGDLAEAAEGQPFALKTHVVYPIAGAMILTVAGVTGAALGMARPNRQQRAALDVVVLVGLFAAGLLMVGAARLLDGEVAQLLDGEQGRRAGVGPWGGMLVGAVAATAASWWLWRQAKDDVARWSLLVVVVSLGTLVLASLVPPVVDEMGRFGTGPQRTSLHALAWLKEQGIIQYSGVSTYLAAAALAWIGVWAGMIAWTLHRIAPGRQDAAIARTAASGAVLLGSAAGTIVTIVALVQVGNEDLLSLSWGMIAMLGHPAVGTFAFLALRAGLRQTAAESTEQPMQEDIPLEL